MSNRGAAVDVVDAIAFELEGGALGTIAANGGMASKQQLQQELRCYGTGGALVQDCLNGAVTFYPADGGPARTLGEAPPEGELEMDAFQKAVAAPFDCLVDLVRGRDVENPGATGPAIAAVELLEAAYRSAAEGGRPVDISELD
jgi:predicted dehydrogenase